MNKTSRHQYKHHKRNKTEAKTFQCRHISNQHTIEEDAQNKLISISFYDQPQLQEHSDSPIHNWNQHTHRQINKQSAKMKVNTTQQSSYTNHSITNHHIDKSQVRNQIISDDNIFKQVIFKKRGQIRKKVCKNYKHDSRIHTNISPITPSAKTDRSKINLFNELIFRNTTSETKQKRKQMLSVQFGTAKQQNYKINAERIYSIKDRLKLKLKSSAGTVENQAKKQQVGIKMQNISIGCKVIHFQGSMFKTQRRRLFNRFKIDKQKQGNINIHRYEYDKQFNFRRTSL